MAGGSILSVHHIILIVLISLSTTVIGGCDRVDQAVSSYLDGCRDKQNFLISESLERIVDDPVILDYIIQISMQLISFLFLRLGIILFYGSLVGSRFPQSIFHFFNSNC